MIRRTRVAACVLAGSLSLGAAMPAVSVANDGHGDHHGRHRSQSCTGTLTAPGVLSGNYWGTTYINGTCVVNAGNAVVHGSLVVTSGSNLVAAFGKNDTTGTGTSNLKVTGDLRVGKGATAIVGCEPNFFTCLDDPDQQVGTLTSSAKIRGDLRAKGALAVLVHHSWIGGDIRQSGGGGGVTCAPPAGTVLGAHMSPAYSDYEDNTVAGDVSITGLNSCWLGFIRNKAQSDVRISHNTMADPDANEIVTNTVAGDLACFANSPAVQFGDSAGASNIVGGNARGQCGFNVLIPNPEPSGPLTPVSVPAP